jgi:hypothetical protein
LRWAFCVFATRSGGFDRWGHGAVNHGPHPRGNRLDAAGERAERSDAERSERQRPEDSLRLGAERQRSVGEPRQRNLIRELIFRASSFQLVEREFRFLGLERRNDRLRLGRPGRRGRQRRFRERQHGFG